jgi:hypothetical protein
MAASPLLGPMGNREFLVHLTAEETRMDIPALIQRAVGSAAA